MVILLMHGRNARWTRRRRDFLDYAHREFREDYRCLWNSEDEDDSEEEEMDLATCQRDRVFLRCVGTATCIYVMRRVEECVALLRMQFLHAPVHYNRTSTRDALLRLQLDDEFHVWWSARRAREYHPFEVEWQRQYILGLLNVVTRFKAQRAVYDVLRASGFHRNYEFVPYKRRRINSIVAKTPLDPCVWSNYRLLCDRTRISRKFDSNSAKHGRKRAITEEIAINGATSAARSCSDEDAAHASSSGVYDTIGEHHATLGENDYRVFVNASLITQRNEDVRGNVAVELEPLLSREDASVLAVSSDPDALLSRLHRQLVTPRDIVQILSHVRWSELPSDASRERFFAALKNALVQIVSGSDRDHRSNVVTLLGPNMRYRVWRYVSPQQYFACLLPALLRAVRGNAGHRGCASTRVSAVMYELAEVTLTHIRMTLVGRSEDGESSTAAPSDRDATDFDLLSAIRYSFALAMRKGELAVAFSLSVALTRDCVESAVREWLGDLNDAPSRRARDTFKRAYPFARIMCELRHVRIHELDVLAASYRPVVVELQPFIMRVAAFVDFAFAGTLSDARSAMFVTNEILAQANGARYRPERLLRAFASSFEACDRMHIDVNSLVRLSCASAFRALGLSCVKRLGNKLPPCWVSGVERLLLLLSTTLCHVLHFPPYQLSRIRGDGGYRHDCGGERCASPFARHERERSDTSAYIDSLRAQQTMQSADEYEDYEVNSL